MPSTACHVNLPLRYIATDDKYLAHFIEHGLHPELGVDAFATERLSPRWHSRLAAKLAAAALTPGVHLPFHDLHPGGVDPLILDASRERLRRGLSIARTYSPTHLVGHALYADILYVNAYGKWLDNSVATWTELAASWPDGPTLFLENVYETRPDSFADLLARLPEGRFGFCLDIGHWFSFGGGRDVDDLAHWLETLAHWPLHLHLHDNDGSRDQHLGLGEGDIPLRDLFHTLKRLDLRPSITLEPHTEQDLLTSLCYLADHPQWFR